MYICKDILYICKIYKDILEYTVHTYDVHICSVAHINPSSCHRACIMSRIINIINNEDLRYWSMQWSIIMILVPRVLY